MIDLQILKKTTNVNKLRYAIKQVNNLFAKNSFYGIIRKDEINSKFNENQIARIKQFCLTNNIENEKNGYFFIPIQIHFFLFIEDLITSFFIKSPIVFTANDFNQFCINTKSVIDTFILGCANNLYKDKNETLRYQDILNSILNSNENIIIKISK